MIKYCENCFGKTHEDETLARDGDVRISPVLCHNCYCGMINDEGFLNWDKLIQHDIDKQFNEIIKSCKMFSKADEYYIEGTEVVFQDNGTCWGYDSEDNIFGYDMVDGVMVGLTMNFYEGYKGELPRLDGELCRMDEFLFIDPFGIDITNMTLKEYKELHNEHK